MGNCFLLKQIRKINVFFRKYASSALKRRGTILLVISDQFNGLHLCWYGGALTPMELAACTMLDAESKIQVLEKHTVCARLDDVFFREGLEYLRKTMLNCILHLLQQRSFVVEECGF